VIAGDRAAADGLKVKGLDLTAIRRYASGPLVLMDVLSFPPKLQLWLQLLRLLLPQLLPKLLPKLL